MLALCPQWVNHEGRLRTGELWVHRRVEEPWDDDGPLDVFAPDRRYLGTFAAGATEMRGPGGHGFAPHPKNAPQAPPATRCAGALRSSVRLGAQANHGRSGSDWI